MFKFLFGALVGSFLLYNFVIPNPNYKQTLDNINQSLLALIYQATQELNKNVQN